MKENKYDDKIFFEKYSQMERSKKGLSAAGEWHILQKMLPDFSNKRVLDLGCGYGWHCRYAVENGAEGAVGVDISQKMIDRAKEKTDTSKIEYMCMPIEDIDFTENSFDIVISSLAFHYIADFKDICEKINRCLVPGGSFVFSVEHPVFTAREPQEWIKNSDGEKLHWPVDNYFIEGKRKTYFLGEEVTKYHKTLTTYLNSLLQTGFTVTQIVEPQPSEKHLKEIPEMAEELRRPMMLLVSAKKR